MKLYYSPGACSLSDHIVLEWIGKPFEVQRVSHAEMKQPDYLRLNPAGAVPVLDDNGFVLTQNAAILGYLADLNPELKLDGDGTPRSRAEVTRWLAFINADVHPSFHPLFGSTAYLEEPEAIEKTRAAARKKLRGLFERANRQLEGREGLAGARSIADPYLFVTTRWAHHLGVDMSGLEHLDAFMQRMDADPGVRRALATES